MAGIFDRFFPPGRNSWVLPGGALLAAAAATLVWLVWLCPPAAAQTTPQLELRQFGWQADGTLSPRSSNPVLVRVSGASDDTVRVQATLKMSVGSANQTFITPIATYAQDVALPRGVSKDVKLWVHSRRTAHMW